MDDSGDLEARKGEHLRISLEEDVLSGVTNGLERYRLRHQALPEMALADVALGTRFLGHALRAPLLISAMTGGTELAREVNRNLALAAQECGLAMGLGSQRAGLAQPQMPASYQVRDLAPDILLLANLGAVQLNYGYTLADCQRAVESVGADALVLHLNPLQEALQPNGDTDFSGLLAKIAQVCAALPYPVIVKEVGWGISGEVARRLVEAGVAAIDVAGAGGTSWSQVESYRVTEPDLAAMAQAFVGWGIPTAEALEQVRRACPDTPLIASGGVGAAGVGAAGRGPGAGVRDRAAGDRAGIETAICLALGADLVGMARALLSAACESAEAVVRRLDLVTRQLRIAMFCAGARTVADLVPALLSRS
ncbi:MAG: type 2 isopentenyl-diphosphate Delta-isomerase [Anaerolineae bacterium]|nr:type 2 isopentenyl-diphosphate Delta-isomerase [Anaerolineae bacterium]